ncbi:MAG: hypothetical protein JRF57_05910 [Deltaproteobacteria bacterium]|nr:hypothetical protein [Deltaproteobacteria bacterium]
MSPLKRILGIAVFFFLLSPSIFLNSPSWARTLKTRPFIEAFPNGKTDWDAGYFYGTGKGYLKPNGDSKARAIKAAEAGALGAILQVAARIRVDDHRTLERLQKEGVILQIRGLIHYEPVERTFIRKENPYYQVTYRAPLRGVEGLATKLLPRLRSGFAPPRPGQGPFMEDLKEDGPWLVLDARGLPREAGIQPALFPRILTEEGETVSDMETVDQEALTRRGMARYVVSEEPLRDSRGSIGGALFSLLQHILGPDPAFAQGTHKRKKRGRYIIKRVKGAEGLLRTNLVISERDAKDLRAEDAASGILKQCRVIVVVSGSIGGIEGGHQGFLAFSTVPSSNRFPVTVRGVP